MKTKVSFIFLGVLTLIVLGTIYLISTDFYPVLIVNWRPISDQYVKGDVAAAVHYYTKAAEVYGKDVSKNLAAENVKKEIKRAVLDKLIENSIIDGEIRSRMSNGDLQSAITSKINFSTQIANIDQEVESIYGLSLEEFRDRVLKPEAEREILIEKFFSGSNSQGGGFDKWIAEAKSRARVIVLISGYHWNGHVMSIK